MALALTHVDFAYGSLPILEDVSLAFPDRGVVCLSGPSGCGKTTLLRLLSGLEQPQRGRIEGLAGRKNRRRLPGRPPATLDDGAR